MFLRPAVVALALAGLPQAASADGPRAVLLSGQICQLVPAGGSGKCYVGRSPSTCLRSVGGKRLALSFSRIASSMSSAALTTGKRFPPALQLAAAIGIASGLSVPPASAGIAAAAVHLVVRRFPTPGLNTGTASPPRFTW